MKKDVQRELVAVTKDQVFSNHSSFFQPITNNRKHLNMSLTDWQRHILDPITHLR